MSARRVLFTDSRLWVDGNAIRRVIVALPPDAVVIHGGAGGADMMAGRIAAACGLQVVVEPANWAAHGRAAGPIRNQRMIDKHAPTEAHAFPLGESRGTRDMIRRLQAAGIPVTVHEGAGIGGSR